MPRLTLLLPLFFSSGCITVQVLCPCHGGHAGPERHGDVWDPQPPREQKQPGGRPVVVAQEQAIPDRRGPLELPEVAYDLGAIPMDPDLEPGDRNVAVVFELDGDEVVGAWYEDEQLAEGGLGLWEELVLRIPANQRADLVQFELNRTSDPVASTDNSGTGTRTGRFGRGMRFSVVNLTRNEGGATAPLSRRRGTFDWTLIHECGHLRSYVDGTTNAFTAAFRTGRGAGEWYPQDGSPRTTGNWVTSYAERAGGDEDCAESFTAYVMLDELPTGDSVAAQKVRWFDERPGYRELRRRLRCTEPDGTLEELAPAPLLDFPLDVRPADWMHGTWRGTLGDGSEVVYEFSADDIVRTRTATDGTTERFGYADARDEHPLAIIDLYEHDGAWYLHQLSFAGRSASESFRKVDGGIEVEHERLGDVLLEPVPR